MSKLRELAYRLDPVPWVTGVVAMTPTSWQETFLRSPRGASILASHRPADRQDHRGGMGDRAFDAV